MHQNGKFSLPDRKNADESWVSHDAVRIWMHVEINRTQKVTFANLTLLAYMCTQSKSLCHSGRDHAQYVLHCRHDNDIFDVFWHLS